MRIKAMATALTAVILAGAAFAADEVRIKIEMEDTTRKEGPPSFVSTALEMYASGGKSVKRFFPKNAVAYYEFEAPRAATYRIWLRYGSHGETQELKVAIDPSGRKDLEAVDLPATGGYEGPGIWRWTRVAEARLEAGKHTVAVGAAPIRPDALIITTSDEEPTDDGISIPKARPLTPEDMKRIAKPLMPVTPEWVENAADYTLPTWYDDIRICAHTRLTPGWRDKPVFFTAARRFASLGLREFVRHIKTGDEGAWWPSAVGVNHEDLAGQNAASRIIDNAHEHGCRIIVYHRHMEDKGMAEAHPDWICRDWVGGVYTRRGKMMCFNSPYADYFEKRLLELVDMGADGFYFDEVHMPKAGCWCDYCKKKFTEETGLTHPRGPLPDAPLWQKLIDFNNLTIARTFVRYRKAIHDRNPEVILLIGTNTYPSMMDRHMCQQCLRIADTIKSEFTLGARHINALSRGGFVDPPKDVRVALGYALTRDPADGRPGHIWINGLRNEASALYACAGVMAHGLIANPDIGEAKIPEPEVFKAAVTLGNRVSPGLARSRPVRWVGVHFSEYARDRYATDATAKWEKVLYPTLAGFWATLRDHRPVGLVMDSQLEQGRLEDVSVLYLPAPDHLTDRMKASVAAFEKRGGLVVRRSPDWKWKSEEDVEAAMDAFRAAVAKAIAPPPAFAEGGTEKMHMMAYRRASDDRLTVAMVNDFAWVPHGRIKKAEAERKMKVPEPCRDVTVVLAGDRAPKKIEDLATGKTLNAKKTPRGYEVAVPEFPILSVLTVEY